ncbi:MAG: tetratricopeptide repeat protein [Verrucomicrobia bacterium]|nr:tetratricopeptide repeat protein [Verrucomicrobiota bacterium]
MNTLRSQFCQPCVGRRAQRWRRTTVLCHLLVAAAWLQPTIAKSADSPPPAWAQALEEIHRLEAAAADQGKESPASFADRYRDLAARFPDQPEVQRACGNALAALGQTQGALPYWQRALALAPADSVSAEALVDALLRLGRVSEAVATMRRAVAARPNDARLHHALGTLLSLFRREGATSAPAGESAASSDAATAERTLHEALAEFLLAAQHAPANAEYARAYAETFYLLAVPDWDHALLAWQNVLALEPAEETDFANSHLARVSLRQRRPAAAREFLARLRDPRFEPLKIQLLRQVEKLERDHPDNVATPPPPPDQCAAAAPPNSNSIPSR